MIQDLWLPTYDKCMKDLVVPGARARTSYLKHIESKFNALIPNLVSRLVNSANFGAFFN